MMNKDNDNDGKTIQKIKESLDFLDSSIDVKKPDVLQLFDLVNAVEEKKKAAKNTQFLVFLIVAAVSVCVEIILFSRSTALFLIIQAVALSCVIPLIVKFEKKRNRQVSL